MVLHACSAECGKKESREQEFMQCARCKSTRYCSKECQKKHWVEGHKKECKKLAAAAVAVKGAMDQQMIKDIRELQDNMQKVRQQLAQITGKLEANKRARDRRALVLKEMDTIGEETSTYLSVGKMYLRTSPTDAQAAVRKEDKISIAVDADLKKKYKYLSEKALSYQAQLEEMARSYGTR